jgi:hypothetical protein
LIVRVPSISFWQLPQFAVGAYPRAEVMQDDGPKASGHAENA